MMGAATLIIITAALIVSHLRIHQLTEENARLRASNDGIANVNNRLYWMLVAARRELNTARGGHPFNIRRSKQHDDGNSEEDGQAKQETAH